MEAPARSAYGRLGARIWLLVMVVTIASTFVPVQVESFDPIAGRQVALVGLGLSPLLLAAPWGRWSLRAQLVFPLAGMAFIDAGALVVGLSRDSPAAFYYVVYFLVIFAFLGLGQPPGTSFAVAPLAAVAYLIPLLAFTDELPAGSWHSVIVVLPVLVLIGETTARASQKLRRARHLDGQRAADLEVLATGTASLARLPSAELAGAVVELARTVLHGSSAELFTGPEIDTLGADVRAILREPDPIPTVILDGAGALLVCPLWSSVETVGVVLVRSASGQPEAFVLNLARLLGRQVGGALEQAQLIGALIEAANMDPLTGVGNRRHAEALLMASCEGDVVVLLDVDHFKQVNDRYGHAVGDEVLAAFGAHLRLAWGVAPVARYGGEEFLAVLRGPSDPSTLVADLLESWRSTSPRATVSAGWARRTRGRSWEEVLAAADAALYDAKRTGRDRVVAGSTPESVHPLSSA